jgi:hypothetical protein
LDEKRTPVIAGLGGAALVAAVMPVRGHPSAPDVGAKAPSAIAASASDSQIEMTSNQEGPWYAFCQEYSTTQFDHGTDPQDERGMKGHRVPEEANALGSIYGASRVVRTGELRRYLALRVVALIRYAMLQIRTLTCFVAYGYVLAVVSVISYAFAGPQALNVLVVATFLALLIWIGMMMAQFQRNALLSRLEGSTPGQVGYGQLPLHLLSVGGLPLLAIVTSQFPVFAEFAFSFFRPVLGALH